MLENHCARQIRELNKLSSSMIALDNNGASQALNRCALLGSQKGLGIRDRHVESGRSWGHCT